MIENPCRACDLADSDKNNDMCRRCKSRAAYVAGLGGMTHSVPDGYASYGSDRAKNKAEAVMPEKETIVTKVCSRKACRHMGRPQPISEFNKHNRSADKLHYWCKTCLSETARERRKKKLRAKNAARDIPSGVAGARIRAMAKQEPPAASEGTMARIAAALESIADVLRRYAETKMEMEP